MDHWQNHAACKDMDPELFFLDNPNDNCEAMITCREQCPVRMECLVFAIEHKIEHGVWGGCGVRARRRIKRRGREVA